MVKKVRLDKFVWAVRLFKKRPDAVKASAKGAILINGMRAKASRGIIVGDEIHVKDNLIYRIYKVNELIEKRVGAKLVENYITEITTEDELFKLKMFYEFNKNQVYREKPGRPTKKDRRDLEDFWKIIF